MRINIELENDQHEYRVELEADQSVPRKVLIDAARAALDTLLESGVGPLDGHIERVVRESTHTPRPTEGAAERPEFLETASNYKR
ncbi:hypothetical protein TIN4_75 [Tsukamurella phage TIN4]|uniref:Uncharacterized protein n=2 Tax=Tinduovirus TIN3 TaxID=1982571 RepID=A0A0K0N5V5_9CAUD|nr:hypothetical protein AVT54_gp050 [Tsukamurella phage TIN3]YP_009604205.1 hypothetical protein FDH87_gp050 [Tsukamurella phage TIN4]AKJ71872.1 hypothetical protein TIN3_75 [Tsukamurella phage TIN3]AKJ71981.1 hypothetical protein TIN4_75 [Tsukamurella phage TIN4]